jgi:hypothetical protein
LEPGQRKGLCHGASPFDNTLLLQQ